MAFALAPWVIIIKRIFDGFGVGIASMNKPFYISVASPARIRGALGSMNVLLFTMALDAWHIRRNKLLFGSS
ncbi:hypothetical protein Q3G72_033459 [Acer saccharum]|nr:hypothetical protein Q3G72_033459 [Acer saccharum]